MSTPQQLVVRDKSMSTDLDALKRARLHDLRQAIAAATDAIYRRTAEHFWRLGEHFQEIRKQRLWLHDEGFEGEDRSFEAWCAARAGWTLAWCERLAKFHRAFSLDELRAAPKLNLAGFLALESAFGDLPEPARVEGRRRALRRLAAAPAPTALDARRAAVVVRAELEAEPEPPPPPPQRGIPTTAPVGPAVAEERVALQCLLPSQGELRYLSARDGSPQPLAEDRLLVLPLPDTGRELVVLLGPAGARWWVAEQCARDL